MNKPFDPWLLVAVLQAAAILLLGWLVFGDQVAAVIPAPTAAPTAVDQPVEPGREQPAPPTPAATGAPASGASLEPLREVAAATIVHGEVRHRSGAVLEVAYLSLFVDDSTRATLTATLRQSPHFAWPALVPATYRMTVRSEGMRNLEHRFVVPPGLAGLRLDLGLEPSWLLKVLLVTPAGQPFHEGLPSLVKERPSLQSFREPVTVVAAWQALPAQLPIMDYGREICFTVATWKSARGPFRGSGDPLPARYAGHLDLPETRAATIGAVAGNVVLAQTNVDAGQDEVTLTVDPEQLLAQLGSVRLQVVDAATQQPVATAKVSLEDAQGWRTHAPVDAEGRVEFPDLRPGSWRLSIEAADRTCPSVAIVVAPGAVTNLGPIAVVAPFLLRLRPTGRTSEKELRCTLIPLDIQNHAALRPASVYLTFVQGGQDGRSPESELHALVVPGRYELHLSGAGGATLEIDTRKLGPDPLVVELQVETALRFDSSGLAEPLRLVLTASNGRKVLDRWITWKGVSEQPLLPGNYTVELTTFTGTTRREELSVPATGASYVLR